MKTRPTVRLVGEDGNIYAIIGRVSSALRRAGYSHLEINKFREEVMSSHDYDEALRTVR